MSGNKERPRPERETTRREHGVHRRGRGRRRANVSFNFVFALAVTTALIVFMGPYSPMFPIGGPIVTGTEPWDERVDVTVLALFVTNMSDVPEIYQGPIEIHSNSDGSLYDIGWQGGTDGVEFYLMNERKYQAWIYPFGNETYMIETFTPYADEEGNDYQQIWYILDKG